MLSQLFFFPQAELGKAKHVWLKKYETKLKNMRWSSFKHWPWTKDKSPLCVLWMHIIKLLIYMQQDPVQLPSYLAQSRWFDWDGVACDLEKGHIIGKRGPCLMHVCVYRVWHQLGVRYNMTVYIIKFEIQIGCTNN